LRNFIGECFSALLTGVTLLLGVTLLELLELWGVLFTTGEFAFIGLRSAVAYVGSNKGEGAVFLCSWMRGLVCDRNFISLTTGFAGLTYSASESDEFETSMHSTAGSTCLG
jgi:hypothetical protein